MRLGPWIVLLAFLLRLIEGSGMVLCVHADGGGRLEWVGATCCGEACFAERPAAPGPELTASDCDCEDRALTPPAALAPHRVPDAPPPELLAIAPDLSALLRPELAPRGSARRGDLIDPGRPRAVATVVLRL